MADSAFYTLGAARRLKAAGMEAEHAEAIVIAANALMMTILGILLTHGAVI